MLSGPSRLARSRPGIRFGLIDCALAPFAAPPGLKQDLTMVVSAEAFFTLTGLAGLAPEEAIASARRAAATITRAAFATRPAIRNGRG